MMKKQSPYTLAYEGVLIAMNVVLSRLVSIPVGTSLRLTVSSVPVILSGMWFGSILGCATGVLGDLIGCVVSGYAPNPLITLSAALMGTIPALLKPFMIKEHSPVRRYLRFLAVIALTMMITSQGTSTLGLALMYGMPFRATWLTRLPQTVFLMVVNSLLCSLLYSRVHFPVIETKKNVE